MEQVPVKVTGESMKWPTKQYHENKKPQQQFPKPTNFHGVHTYFFLYMAGAIFLIHHIHIGIQNEIGFLSLSNIKRCSNNKYDTLDLYHYTSQNPCTISAPVFFSDLFPQVRSIHMWVLPACGSQGNIIYRGMAVASSSALSLFAKACFIADNLFQTCVLVDNGKRLRETGSVAPATTLKAVVARKAFEWAGRVTQQRKFFTLASCRLAIKLLVDRKGVQYPQIPSLPYDCWVEQQAKIVCHLCQRCRRNSGSVMRFAGYKQSQLTMDWAETVPLEVGYHSVNVMYENVCLILATARLMLFPI